MNSISLHGATTVAVAFNLDCVGYTDHAGNFAVKAFDCVMITLRDGRDIYLPNHKFIAGEFGNRVPVARYDAVKLINKILAARIINLDHWQIYYSLTPTEQAEEADHYAEIAEWSRLEEMADAAANIRR